MGNIGTALMRGPLLRSQAIASSTRAIEEAEMAKAAEARAGLLDAQRQEITTGDTRIDNATSAASAASKAFLAFQQNPTPENRAAWQDAVSDATGKASAIKNMKVGDLIKAIGSTGALDLAGSGSTNYAQMGAEQGQAASIANADTAANERAQRPVIIPTGGTEASPTGAILAQGGVTLPQGDQRLAPAVGTAQPSVVATNPKPTKPAGTPPPAVLGDVFKQLLKNSQGGTNVDQTMTEMQPYLTGQVKPATNSPPTTVPDSRGFFSRLLNVFDPGSVPVPASAAPAAQPAVSPTGQAALSGHMVRIQDPLGNIGTIPAENLAAALQRGAKQVQ